MRPWMRTALAVALVLAIAAGGFFLPNLVAARLDRAEQDTAFSLSTGDEQGPATVLRRKLTDGMQNLFYSAEDPVELDESAAAHTRDDMTRYAQTFLTALYKDCELFGADFTVDGVSVDYASYGSGFVLWSITLSDPRGDSVTLLLDDTTGCPLAIGYSFADSYAFQLEQNGLWSYLLRVFENRIAVTISAALGATYDEVQIPMPDAAKKMLRLSAGSKTAVPLRLLNAGSADSNVNGNAIDYLQFYDPDADTVFSLPARHSGSTLLFNTEWFGD
mgnify:CR=1 FL=1